MANIFEVAWERETVSIALCVGPVVVVDGDHKDIFILKTFTRMDSLNDDGIVGLVIWRAVKNLNFGVFVSLKFGDEIGKF